MSARLSDDASSFSTDSRQRFANAIRVLSMDAVQRANSGHPGAPMGLADIAEVLWRAFLKHNPQTPDWVDRDRFVLSNGHAAMLLYSVLHLSGYNLSIEDLKDFRQLGSKTPGHPEWGHTPGVETTTGPLGQGLANAVGMALSEKTLGARFNRPNHTIVDHYTYVFVGDGCLMEGISHEACSLAGTLKLGKLIVFYDDNGISIDGPVDAWFSENTAQRFEAYGWHVVPVVDGHDSLAIHAAIVAARRERDRPSLIVCQTILGYGSPNRAGTAEAHGSPLGTAEIAAARQVLEWEHYPFELPEAILDGWNGCAQGAAWEIEWKGQFSAYEALYPELAAEFLRTTSGRLPEEWFKKSSDFIAFLQATPQSMATRQASQQTLAQFSQWLPELFGGSADLTPSNLTSWSGSVAVNSEPDGNYLHYGVREFAMSAMLNGMALHGGFIPFGGTFLVFMDYARNAVRLAALMRQRVLFIYTHDSIGLGEDGPTHQPVEQLAFLRVTPDIMTWRPCDRVESAVAWKHAIERQEGPSALVFSRQALLQQERDDSQLAAITSGGYLLKGSLTEIPQLILIATGSEVALAVAAYEQLEKAGYAVRVVSMPCTELFDKASPEYRESVLPHTVRARIAVEAGIADFWYKYVGIDGVILGMEGFGASGKAEALFQHFGFTVERLIECAMTLLNRSDLQSTRK